MFEWKNKTEIKSNVKAVFLFVFISVFPVLLSFSLFPFESNRMKNSLCPFSIIEIDTERERRGEREREGESVHSVCS